MAERSLSNALDAIDAIGQRYAPYGGSGIYSGGEYDNFRRSENVEDRRKEKYSQDPYVFDPNPKWYWNYLNVDDGFGDNILGRALGIQALLGASKVPLISGPL
jgi:hypothetical protein